MPHPPTARMGLVSIAGTDLVNQVDDYMKDLVDEIDPQVTLFSKGTLASRPTSTPGTPGVEGRLYYATDVFMTFYDHGTGWTPAGPDHGDIKPTGRSSAPDGWLLCDGSAVSRTAEATAALFAAIGTTYGVGNGTTTFNLPDLRGRVPVGVDGAAGRLSASDALGNAAGAATHTLTTGEMPAHTHSYNDLQIGLGADLAGPGGFNEQDLARTTGSTGGGAAHNNLQPYQVVNYLIKT